MDIRGKVCRLGISNLREFRSAEQFGGAQVPYIRPIERVEQEQQCQEWEEQEVEFPQCPFVEFSIVLGRRGYGVVVDGHG